jgi:hypothetical protein
MEFGMMRSIVSMMLIVAVPLIWHILFSYPETVGSYCAAEEDDHGIKSTSEPSPISALQ